MINKRLIIQAVVAACYGIFSIFMMTLTNEFLSVWMGINAGFALIALMLITMLKNRQEEIEYKNDIVSLLLLLAFIFFLPNTFYVITDLIHIDTSEFYHHIMYDGTIYHTIIDPYLMLSHILFTLLIGLYTGVESLYMFYKLLKKKIKDIQITYVLVFSLIVLSSIGIYIGRFLRLFSWDILNPFNVIRMFIESLELFSFAFIGLFTILQVILFVVYVLVIKKEELQSV